MDLIGLGSRVRWTVTKCVIRKTEAHTASGDLKEP